MHRLFCTAMRCDTSFGEAPQHAVLLLPTGLRAPALCSCFYSPPKGRSQAHGFKKEMLQYAGKKRTKVETCLWIGVPSPPPQGFCGTAKPRQPHVRGEDEYGWNPLLLQRERCMRFVQCRTGAASFLPACRNAGGEESWSTRGWQPWGRHGLSVHGSDTSAACWGSTETREGDFIKMDRLVCVVTGKVQQEGSCLRSFARVSCRCGGRSLGFAGSSLKAEGQNPNSCSCPHPGPKSPKISHFFTDFSRVLNEGSILLAPKCLRLSEAYIRLVTVEQAETPHAALSGAQDARSVGAFV